MIIFLYLTVHNLKYIFIKQSNNAVKRVTLSLRHSDRPLVSIHFCFTGS
jgi:hypothetical protein